MRSSDFYKSAKTKIEEAKAIRSKAEADKRDITAEEDGQILSLLAEAEAIQKKGDTQKKLEAAEAALIEIPDPPEPSFQRPPAEPRDPKEEGKFGFKNLGDFALSVYNANPNINGGYDRRLQPLAAASGLNQAIGPEGGFLVPQTFNQQIWDGFNALPDNLLARTDQYTVTGDTLTMNANAETSRVTGSRYGGIRGYWKAEAAQMTSSKPTFREVKIEPHDLYVYAFVTDKLLRNSAIALDQYLAKAAADEINFLVGDAIINGDGAAKPKGIVGHACTVSVAKETGQLAKTIVTENLVNMHARLHPKSRPNAIWLINPDIEPQLGLLSIGVGTAGQPVFLPPGGISAAPYGTILGKPVIPCEYCQTLGTAGDIILCDLKAYLTGTQGGINSAMSIHLRFDYNETAFRFIFAVDGQPWLSSPITPYKGSNTLSPFITLAVRA